jgi:hypothetical protein
MKPLNSYLVALIAIVALVLAGLSYFRPPTPSPGPPLIPPGPHPTAFIYVGLAMQNGVCAVTSKEPRTVAHQGQTLIWMIGSSCTGVQQVEVVFSSGDPLEPGAHSVSVNGPVTLLHERVRANANKTTYPYIFRLNGVNADPEIVIE